MLWNKTTKYPNIFTSGACIYSLTNLKNGKRYIGMTEKLDARMKYHYYSLKKGNHPNEYMQEDFDKGDDFIVEVLFEFSEFALIPKKEKILETFFILRYNSVENGYNKSYNYNNEKSAREVVMQHSEYICRKLIS